MEQVSRRYMLPIDRLVHWFEVIWRSMAIFEFACNWLRDTQVHLKSTYALHRKNASRVTSDLELMEGDDARPIVDDEVSKLTRLNPYHSFSARDCKQKRIAQSVDLKRKQQRAWLLAGECVWARKQQDHVVRSSVAEFYHHWRLIVPSQRLFKQRIPTPNYSSVFAELIKSSLVNHPILVYVFFGSAIR